MRGKKEMLSHLYWCIYWKRLGHLFRRRSFMANGMARQTNKILHSGLMAFRESKQGVSDEWTCIDGLI